MPRAKSVTHYTHVDKKELKKDSSTIVASVQDEAEVMDYAEELGDRLGLFVAALDMPLDKKGVLLALMDEMTMPQLIDWYRTLESLYIAQCSGAYDKYYARDLVRDFSRTEKQKGHILEKAAADIRKLTEQLQQSTLKAQITNA